ncbi:MAG: hypothetical protein Q4G40_12665, partial [Brachybacterium sp.]|nr:hypothetical protein [Brachybacterium sp.]
QRIVRATDGIPLKLETLVAQLLSPSLGAASLDAAIDKLEGQWARESGLTFSVSRSIADISPQDRTVLDLIAVGNGLTDEDVRRAAASRGLTVDLEVLRATGLLDEGDRLQIRHQELRRALLDLLDPAARAQLHRELGAVVGGDRGLRHRMDAQQGGEVDVAVMGEILQRMGAAAERSSLDEACQFAAMAAELDPTLTPMACLFALRARREDSLLSHRDRITDLPAGGLRDVLLGVLAVYDDSGEPEVLKRVAVGPQTDTTVLTLLGFAYHEIGRRDIARGRFGVGQQMRRVQGELQRRADVWISEDRHREAAELFILAALLGIWLAFDAREGESSTTRTMDNLAVLIGRLEQMPFASPALAAALETMGKLKFTSGRAAQAWELYQRVDAMPWQEEIFVQVGANNRLNALFMAGEWDRGQSIIEHALARSLDNMLDVGTLRTRASAAQIPLSRGEDAAGQKMLDQVTHLSSGEVDIARISTGMARAFAGAVNNHPRDVIDGFRPVFAGPLSGWYVGPAALVLLVRAYVQEHDLVGAQESADYLESMELDREALDYYRSHIAAVLAAGMGQWGKAAENFARADEQLSFLLATQGP